MDKKWEILSCCIISIIVKSNSLFVYLNLGIDKFIIMVVLSISISKSFFEFKKFSFIIWLLVNNNLILFSNWQKKPVPNL